MLTIEMVRPLYKNDSAHDFEHVLRVLANAEQIGQAEAANMELLQAAVLLHDIARADQESTGKEHAAEGARRAQEMLTEQGYPADFVEAVVHAIAAHRYRIKNPPLTLEAKILYDADKLDSIGAVGLGRAFAYGGYINRPLWSEDPASAHTVWHEFQIKLSKVKDTLFTDTARQIATNRHEFMVQFVAQMSAEVQGKR